MTSIPVSPPVQRLSARDRLDALLDPGTTMQRRAEVHSRTVGGGLEGDGVILATGRVDGRPVACFAQDPSVMGGSLSVAHADGIVRLLDHAARARVPVIGFVESAGARIQEGVGALDGYARIFRAQVSLSGLVPQISVVCGVAAGGAAYGPALTEHVITTPSSAMFLTGPAVVREVTGETVDAASLGGCRLTHRTGVAHLHADSDAEAALLARELLDYLPQHSTAEAIRWPSSPALGGAVDVDVPASVRKVYDVRSVARRILDAGRMLEVSPRWAKNVICAYARLNGRPVGLIANQPRHLGGILDADGATKAARFVRTCNLFGLPLLVLVDTPGFLPGLRQEERAVIRHGAKLVHAFAEASVPRVTVVLRQAFGGAFIAMNSKGLGADAVFAWPAARLGIMGSTQAVKIVHRREIAAGARTEALAEQYAQRHLSAANAASEGYIDAIIVPGETRRTLTEVFEGLSGYPRDELRARGFPL